MPDLSELYFGKPTSKKSINDLIKNIEAICCTHDNTLLGTLISKFLESAKELKIAYWGSTSASSVTLPSIKNSLCQIMPHLQDESLTAEDRAGYFTTAAGLVNHLNQKIHKKYPL